MLRGENFDSCWARAQTDAPMRDLKHWYATHHDVKHWSRAFEYPWVSLQGVFEPGQWCLDAAGGDGALQHFLSEKGVQVVNVDLDTAKQPSVNGVLSAKGDLKRLSQFHENVFSRVVCVSVLEHIDDPQSVVRELWRVLASKGRLLVTFDVAPNARHNHTIDLSVARSIFGLFGQRLTEQPEDVLKYTFDELSPEPHEPRKVELKVLCFRVDKP
jgi:ubiquinone/menaquinone biosynthesis C-methylase UbiE